MKRVIYAVFWRIVFLYYEYKWILKISVRRVEIQVKGSPGHLRTGYL